MAWDGSGWGGRWLVGSSTRLKSLSRMCGMGGLGMLYQSANLFQKSLFSPGGFGAYMAMILVWEFWGQ